MFDTLPPATPQGNRMFGSLQGQMHPAKTQSNILQAERRWQNRGSVVQISKMLHSLKLTYILDLPPQPVTVANGLFIGIP